MDSLESKIVASFLLCLNCFMYVIVLAIGGWAANRAIDEGFFIGPELDFPPQFSPICFPMGNPATGFFVVFSLIAGIVGVVSVIVGIDIIRHWHDDPNISDYFPATISTTVVAWVLTSLAMGFAWKEIELQHRNVKLRTMEALMIILAVTQLTFISVIHKASTRTFRK